MKGPRNRLKVVRAEKELSQLDIAQRTGIKEYRYWRIENGYVIPTDGERALIAKALKVPEAVAWPEQEVRAS